MRKSYAYHKPSEAGLKTIADVREAYSNLHDVIARTCPESRELSVALTELETSAMWAIKSVVCNDPQSELQA